MSSETRIISLLDTIFPASNEYFIKSRELWRWWYRDLYMCLTSCKPRLDLDINKENAEH